MSPSPVLDISKVSKRFPGVWALRDVCLQVLPGEVHGLVGENGAGKSTLMAIASGALAPDEGSVLVGGADVSADPREVRQRGLAIVRQEPALMPDLSVADNIFLGVAAAYRPRMNEKQSWADGLLRAWDPANRIEASIRVDLLNAQQRFVVEIVKALANRPSVLLLDEPTEHLPGADIERLFANIRLLAKEGVGIVYISHRIREVGSISDRITVLREGRSRGTYPAPSLSEHDIVELIVGRAIDREYPEKASPPAGTTDILATQGLSGQGFHDVSLRLRRSEIVGFAGMDGQGKREFLKALAGENRSNGPITVGNVRTTLASSAQAARLGIQYLSGSRHHDGMFADLPVSQNFSFRTLPRFVSAGLIRGHAEAAAAAEAAHRFEVKTPSVDTRIGSLSGGNQQKVLIAGVLASEPRIVLIDEPTQGVDIGSRVFIYQAIRDAAERGTTFVIVSSSAAELAGLCDRVLVFSRGHVTAELAGEALSENSIVREVLTSGSSRRHGERRLSGTDRVMRWLAGHWAPVAMVTMAAVLLGLYAGTSNPFYLSERNLGGLLTFTAALALVAYGQQILLLVGGIDLSVGPLMGLTTVLMSFSFGEAASFEAQVGGWTIVLGAALLVGLVNWLLVDPVGMHPMMATLATFMLLQAIALMLRPTPDGMISFDLLDTINMRWSSVPVAALLALALAVALEAMLFRSTLGLKLRGFGSRPESARVAGVSSRKIRLIAYMSCSLLAALAGVLMVGQVGIGDAMSGNDYTLASIAAGVIGGASLFGARGSFLGALIGALLITQVNTVTTFLDLSDAWRSILLGLMIVVSVALYSKARKLVVLA